MCVYVLVLVFFCTRIANAKAVVDAQIHIDKSILRLYYQCLFFFRFINVRILLSARLSDVQ